MQPHLWSSESSNYDAHVDTCWISIWSNVLVYLHLLIITPPPNVEGFWKIVGGAVEPSWDPLHFSPELKCAIFHELLRPSKWSVRSPKTKIGKKSFLRPNRKMCRVLMMKSCATNSSWPHNRHTSRRCSEEHGGGQHSTGGHAGGCGKNVPLAFTNLAFALFLSCAPSFCINNLWIYIFLTQYKKLVKVNLFQYNGIKMFFSSMQKWNKEKLSSFFAALHRNIEHIIEKKSLWIYGKKNLVDVIAYKSLVRMKVKLWPVQKTTLELHCALWHRGI